MAKRSTSEAKPARAPSPASQRKAAAVEAYTKQTGSAPPKGWTTAKIEGRTRTLGYTGVSGTGYTTPRDGRAAAKAPLPADAYKQKFGYSPPADMSGGAMKRWTDSPMKVGPGRTGDAAYERAVNSAKTRALDAISRLPAQPAGQSNLVVPKSRSTHSSVKSAHALGNAPHEIYRAVVDAKWRDGDRNAAAKVLREYRSNQLGRNMGPVARTVTKIANSTPAKIAAIGATGLMFGLYAEDIAKGFMFDGVRGAVGTALSKASFGMTDKAYGKITGKPDAGKAVARAFGMRSPGLAGMDRRKEKIESRPTRKMREGIDKANGVKSPAIPATRAQNHDLVNSVGAITMGTVLAAPAVAANTYALHKASGVLMKGVGMVSPAAAKIGARVLPGVGLGVMAAGAVWGGVQAFKRGDGAAGVAKSAAFGAMGLSTGPRLTSDQKSKFDQANMDYHQKTPGHGTTDPNAAGKGWANGRGFANPDVQEAAQEGRRKKLGIQ